jgi:hypothetical protein
MLRSEKRLRNAISAEAIFLYHKCCKMMAKTATRLNSKRFTFARARSGHPELQPPLQHLITFPHLRAMHQPAAPRTMGTPSTKFSFVAIASSVLQHKL